MIPLKQSTAKTMIFGPLLDATDGITSETGLISALDHASTGIAISKSGAAMAVRNAAVTASVHDADGYYRIVLDTTDTNTLGELVVRFANAACLPHWQKYVVYPANVFDSLFSGSDLLDVNAAQLNGTSTGAQTQLTAAPVVNGATVLEQINWAYHELRNKKEITDSAEVLKRADGSTTLATRALSDNGTTLTKGAPA